MRFYRKQQNFVRQLSFNKKYTNKKRKKINKEERSPEWSPELAWGLGGQMADWLYMVLPVKRKSNKDTKLI